MEWVVLMLLAGGAALLIALPRHHDRVAAAEELHAERAHLLAELRELDDDLEAGRISTDDRLNGRRALAPRLRAVTEALRESGEEPRGFSAREDTR